MQAKKRGGREHAPKITVHEVAHLAEVSIATVSRTFNNPDSVRKELRERVEKAAERLGYKTNSAAKALRRQRTQIIGTVLPKLNDMLFSEIASGIQEALVENGYVGFLQTAGFDNRNLLGHARLLLDRGAEALIIFGRIDDPDLINYLAAHSIPCVVIYSFLQNGPVPSIGIDNYQSARQLIDLVLQLGHTEVAMITGPVGGNDRQQSRLQAFNDALLALNLEPIVYSIDKNYTMSDGSVAMRRLHAEHPEITAVICNSDVLAFGVLSECRRIGLSVPRDISVTGFDDMSFASLLDPPLTTVSVPAAEIGRQAALALIKNLEEGHKILPARFETDVILRKSAAAPRRKSGKAA